MASKFIKNYSIVYNIYRKKMSKISGDVSQTMLAKRTRDTLDTVAFRLTATAQGKQFGSKKLQLRLDEALTLDPQTSLTKSFPRQGYRTELKFPLSFHQSPWERLGSVWLSICYIWEVIVLSLLVTLCVKTCSFNFHARDARAIKDAVSKHWLFRYSRCR